MSGPELLDDLPTEQMKLWIHLNRSTGANPEKPRRPFSGTRGHRVKPRMWVVESTCFS